MVKYVITNNIIFISKLLQEGNACIVTGWTNRSERDRERGCCSGNLGRRGFTNGRRVTLTLSPQSESLPRRGPPFHLFPCSSHFMPHPHIHATYDTWCDDVWCMRTLSSLVGCCEAEIRALICTCMRARLYSHTYIPRDATLPYVCSLILSGCPNATSKSRGVMQKVQGGNTSSERVQ